jgi:hypothetical protein
MAHPLNTTRDSAIIREAAELLPRIFSDRVDLAVRPSRSPRLAAVVGGGTDRDGGFDFVFRLASADEDRLVYVEVKARALSDSVERFIKATRRLRRSNPRAVPLFVVPHLSDRARGMLRERGINHADFAGTVFVRAPGLIVDVQGVDEPYRASPDTDVNPFADRASLVLRTILANPTVEHRVTDLAGAAAVSKGWVSLVAGELESRGYVRRERGRIRLADPVRVLHDWSTQYTWRENHVESYIAPFSYREVLDRLAGFLSVTDVTAALTLLAASDLVAPHVTHDQVHLYVAPQVWSAFQQRARKHLMLEPVPAEEGGTFHLVLPHYTRSVFFNHSIVRSVPVVSPVQLYLDLVHFPLRGLEAADVLVRTQLAPLFKLSPLQVRELV